MSDYYCHSVYSLIMDGEGQDGYYVHATPTRGRIVVVMGGGRMSRRLSFIVCRLGWRRHLGESINWLM